MLVRPFACLTFCDLAAGQASTAFQGNTAQGCPPARAHPVDARCLWLSCPPPPAAPSFLPSDAHNTYQVGSPPCRRPEASICHPTSVPHEEPVETRNARRDMLPPVGTCSPSSAVCRPPVWRVAGLPSASISATVPFRRSLGSKRAVPPVPRAPEGVVICPAHHGASFRFAVREVVPLEGLDVRCPPGSLCPSFTVVVACRPCPDAQTAGRANNAWSVCPPDRPGFACCPCDAMSHRVCRSSPTPCPLAPMLMFAAMESRA